jgi:serine/threonine-protein kinase SRPK3
LLGTTPIYVAMAQNTNTKKLFELITGQPPFDTIMMNPATLVSQMMEFSTDELPDRWRKKWQTMDKSLSEDGAAYTLQQWLEEVYFDEDRHSEFTKHDITKISELVGRLLKFEPSSRARTRDILNDPWFSHSIS